LVLIVLLSFSLKYSSRARKSLSSRHLFISNFLKSSSLVQKSLFWLTFFIVDFNFIHCLLFKLSERELPWPYLHLFLVLLSVEEFKRVDLIKLTKFNLIKDGQF
jgi:hypothetical protein